jgi:hypothetical protein
MFRQPENFPGLWMRSLRIFSGRNRYEPENIFGRVPVVAENIPGQSSLAPVYTKATTREH